MPDFVLVRHENGIVKPVPREFAERRKLDIVDGPAVDLTGRPVRAVRDNGRPVKKKTSVAKKAAEQKAVTPPEGAAETTLTNTKE